MPRENDENKRMMEANKRLVDQMDYCTRHIYDTYTSVQKPPKDIRVRLQIGVQGFHIDDGMFESVHEAEWHRIIMLAKALANLVEQEGR